MGRSSHWDSTSKRHLRTDTSQGNLHTHGCSHFLTTEPLGNHLGYSNTRYFGTHTKDRITSRSHHHTRTETEYLSRIFCQGSQTIIFECSTKHHENSREFTGKPYSKAVENQSAPKEHQQEYIKETISTGIGSELCTAPRQFGFEHRLERHHHIIYEISRHHRKGHYRQGTPAHSGRIIQSSFFHCSN